MRLLIPILILLSFFNCSKSNLNQNYFASTNLYARTVKKINDVVLFNNFPPMIASRNYAYACIAANETLAAANIVPSLSKTIKHLPKIQINRNPQNANIPLAALLSLIKVGNAVTFPEGVLMSEYNNLLHIADSLGYSKTLIDSTIAFSDSVVSSILKWSKKDNYLQTRSGQKFAVKPNDDSRWRPTPPPYMEAVEPNWEKIRPMFLDSASQFPVPPPPPVNLKNKQSLYHHALTEVMTIGNNLTDEQKEIADFWDDNPFKINVIGHLMFATKKFSPPGHWLNIIGIAATQTKAPFSKTVQAFAWGSASFFDAFIACWYEKYKYAYVRPETNINKFLDKTWRPYIQTPPFPSYTSGHATNSACVAEVMTHFFSDTLQVLDSSLVEFGQKARTLPSFRIAAKEAAMSRLYGGIHYRFDNEVGNIYGKKIGEFIVSKAKNLQPK